MEKDLTNELKAYREEFGKYQRNSNDFLHTISLLGKLSTELEHPDKALSLLQECYNDYLKYLSMFDSISFSSYSLDTNRELTAVNTFLHATTSFLLYTERSSESLSSLICSYRYLITLQELLQKDRNIM